MESKDGVLIGQKGVKYGLQKPALAAKKPALAAQPVRKPAVFGADDSDEDFEAEVARVAEKKRTAQKVQQAYEQALAEDPSVFDYDGVYDQMQAAKANPRQQEKLARQSKYIAQLKEQADKRKIEEEIRFERRLLKERTQEDALYEDKEKFVTAAYKKKLEEDKKWIEQQKLKDEEDARNDVRKVGHMSNFYSNLYKQKMGVPAPADKPAEPEADAAQPTEAKPAVSAKAPVLDKYELMRLEAERARKAAAAGAQGSEQGAAAQDVEPVQAQMQAGQDGEGDQVAADVKQEVAVKQEQGADGGKPGVTGGKRRNDDDAVMSARERYLARKKKMTE